MQKRKEKKRIIQRIITTDQNERRKRVAREKLKIKENVLIQKERKKIKLRGRQGLIDIDKGEKGRESAE